MKISKNLFKKLICIALLVLFLCCMVTSSVNAEAFAKPSEFDNKGVTDENVNNLVNNTAVTVIAIARVTGATIAIVMLLVIAIKYMVSSAGDRADIKKHAVAYVVGAVVLFGAVGILGIIDEFVIKALPAE